MDHDRPWIMTVARFRRAGADQRASGLCELHHLSVYGAGKLSFQYCLTVSPPLGDETVRHPVA
jgi:hypothetical protein